MLTTLSSTFEKENSSDDQSKCLMAKIVESHADVSNDNVRTLDVDLSHVDKDFKSEWDDTSMYQVKNHVNISSVENIKKDDTIDHLHFDLLISNKEKSSLSHELKKLK